MLKFISFIFLLGFSTTSFGQIKGAVEQSERTDLPKRNDNPGVTTVTNKAKKNATKLKQSLGLSDQQYEEVYKALLDYESNVDKLNKSKLSSKDQYAKMKVYNKTRETKLKTILTKEQYHDYLMSFP